MGFAHPRIDLTVREMPIQQKNGLMSLMPIKTNPVSVYSEVLISDTVHVLKQFIDVLENLEYDDYVHKQPLLGGASIGEHTRHAIELFQQLIQSYAQDKVNYDLRNRDIQLQENIDFALHALAEIICSLNRADKYLQLSGIHLGDNEIETTYFRELLYNLEHCIHHQAIIKIALLNIGITEISPEFGMAKSTLNYRKQCAR